MGRSHHAVAFSPRDKDVQPIIVLLSHALEMGECLGFVFDRSRNTPSQY